MPFKSVCIGGQPSIPHGAHQVESTAGPIIFIAGDRIGGARFETQAAMNAGEQLLFFTSEGVG